MAASVPSDSVMTLGRKLVEELGLGESNDTLGRWMAHYIAELITKAEEASGDQKDIAERECASAILALWQHRSELPDGRRPFEELEPVMRAVESLDPECNVPRYYGLARPPKEDAPETSEQMQWLAAADGVDHSAKLLIGYCLAEAAGTALDKSKEWVKLAEDIDADGVPEMVIRFVVTASDGTREQEDEDPNDEIRARLQDRIKRLQDFLKMSESLVSTLEDRLQALS